MRLLGTTPSSHLEEWNVSACDQDLWTGNSHVNGGRFHDDQGKVGQGWYTAGEKQKASERRPGSNRRKEHSPCLIQAFCCSVAFASALDGNVSGQVSSWPSCSGLPGTGLTKLALKSGLIFVSKILIRSASQSNAELPVL